MALNTLSIIWTLTFGSLLTYSLYDVATNYSNTTGYNVYDILAVMVVSTILINIYIYVSYKLFQKIKTLNKDVINNG